jgi:hypothetical protein
MTEEELRRAIERPAERAGLVLEPGLPEGILRDIVGEPGALPLLSHSLLETWLPCLLEPSNGLEPSTPSLPLRLRPPLGALGRALGRAVSLQFTWFLRLCHPFLEGP